MRTGYGKRGGPAQQKREQKVIREIAYSVALGCTAGVVASHLNERQGPGSPVGAREPIPAPEGGTWSRKQVERIIEGHPRAMARGVERLAKERGALAEATKPTMRERFPEPSSLDPEDDVRDYDLDENDNPVFRVKTEAEKDAKRIESERIQQEATAARLDPRTDWTFYDPANVVATVGDGQLDLRHMDAEQRIGKLGLSGKDTWDKVVDALVVEMTENTGKDAHALLDQIAGQPDVRGQLRRVFFGMMREIALQRQANLSLRQQLGQRVRTEKPAPTMEEVEAKTQEWKKAQQDQEFKQWTERFDQE